MGGKNLAQVET